MKQEFTSQSDSAPIEGVKRPKSWQFGSVLVEEGNSKILVSGEPVSLDWTCYSILLALLHSNSEPVSKRELLEVAWPGKIVQENSLAKVIGRLRKALGTGGQALETVHGFGYRLVATAHANGGTTADNGHFAAQPRRSLRWWPYIALAAIAAGIWAGFEFWRQDETAALRIGEHQDAIGRVLWVDDHPENNIAEVRFLEEQGIAVYQITNSPDALKILSMYDSYTAVISDLGRGEDPLAGFRLVEELRRRENDIPFFVYTILPSDAQRHLLVESGGQGVATNSRELYGMVLPLFQRESEMPAAR